MKFIKNPKKTSGVNLIGFPRGDFGIGQHIRLVTRAFAKTKIPFCVNESDLANHHSHSNEEINNLIIKENEHKINLFCMNAIQVHLYMTKRLNEIIKSQYNIGYGYWEISKFPKLFKKQFKHIDEIWAPSKFIYEMIKKCTTLPVYHMPIPVDFPIPHHITRKSLCLPEDRFLFLFSFDMSSYIKRKNPEAVIRCFQKAFKEQKSNKVGLVIKTQRIKENLQQEKEFSNFFSLYNSDNVFIIDEIFSREKMLGLINCCDVYVSLHRSEGFGLGLAEAMRMGKNVIGTNYSGNCDFMNAENSCLVPYKMIKVNKGEYLHFEDGMVWAEPDENIAIKFMQQLYNDSDYRNKLRMAAKKYIEEYHSFEYIAQKYEKRINQIELALHKKN